MVFISKKNNKKLQYGRNDFKVFVCLKLQELLSFFFGLNLHNLQIQVCIIHGNKNKEKLYGQWFKQYKGKGKMLNGC